MKRVRKFWSHEGTPTQLFEVSLFVVISVPVGVRIFSVVLLRTSCGVLSNTTYFRFTCFQFCYHTLLINVSVCTCRSRVDLWRSLSNIGENINRVLNCFDSRRTPRTQLENS